MVITSKYFVEKIEIVKKMYHLIVLKQTNELLIFKTFFIEVNYSYEYNYTYNTYNN